MTSPNVSSSAPASPLAPTGSVAAIEDPSTHLAHRLTTRWDDLLNALQSSSFYVEFALVALALGLAWLAARFLSQKIKQRLAVSPPKFIDSEFITRPLLLLGPLLALLFVWLIQPLATGIGLTGNFTAAVLQLCYAYLLVKGVFLIVRSRPVACVIAAAVIVNALLHAAKVMRSTDAYLDSIAFDLGAYHITALHMARALVIFVVVFWGAGLLSRTLESYLRRSTSLSNNARLQSVKFFRLFVYLIAVVVTLSSVGIDLTAFAIFGGALGVGVGLGLQKITANFVSGITVLMERSIKIGDLIEVGGYTGWVRQINIRYVLLETSDGREIMIPNEELVSTRIINWTLTTTMARIEMDITINVESDAKKAHTLLLEAAQEHKRCLSDPKPTCWLREIAGGGIHFMLAFWISDVKEGRNGPQSDVLFAVLEKFQKNGIALAKA